MKDVSVKSLLLAALCCLAIVAITGTAVAQSSNSSLDARIDGPRNPSMGELARFSGSDSSGDIVEYRWYVNGERRTGRTLRYRFQNTGRYDVELTVEGPDGRTDRTTKTVVVRFEPRCTVSKTDIRPGDRVTIDASKSRGATYYRYSKYGDGSYTRWTRSDSKTFRYEDPVEKRFSPDLEIAGRDKNNINGDSCPTINVRQREPVSRFEVRPDTPDVGQKVVIDARDSEPPRNGRIVKYEYDVDGDNRFEYDNRNGVLKYSYDSKGRRIIRVRVTSNLDVKSTSSTSIHVKGSSITASFSYSPNNPKVGDPVTFRSNSKTRAGLITDWRWMINGQVMSRDKSFKHTFGEPGKARVQLRVKSSTNQKNDETKFLKIQKQPGAKLSANVRMNPKTAKPGETLKLWVIGNPITVSWDLDDDGIYEKVGNPIKTSFDNAGTQTIKVKISEDGTQTVQTVQINLQRLNLLEAIDQNGNGRIDSVEKTAAVTYWQDNDNVPGYEGKITDEQMIKIINYYRDGTEFVQD